MGDRHGDPAQRVGQRIGGNVTRDGEPPAGRTGGVREVLHQIVVPGRGLADGDELHVAR